MSDSLRPHGLQHARPPHPSPTPGVYPNSRLLSWWRHPTTSSSVIPFSSCPQSFPAWGSFPMSQLFVSGGQSTGVSASTSVLPMNTQDWFPLGWAGWISFQDSQESSPTPQFKSINSSALSFLHSPTLTSIHDHWKTITLTRQTLVGKVMSLLFNMLSMLVITFLPRSNCLLISWLQSPSAVILEPKKIVWHCFYCLPIYFPWGNGTRCHDLSGTRCCDQKVVGKLKSASLLYTTQSHILRLASLYIDRHMTQVFRGWMW